MVKSQFQRIEELFHHVADLEPAARAAFLDAECGRDAGLRAAVEELLRHDDEPSGTGSLLGTTVARSRSDDWTPVSRARSEEALALLRNAIDGYELVDVLGSGGMGVVFKARQLSLNRLVALKMLLSAAPIDAGRLARFRIEAESLARLQHPNIVQIYEIGEHEGRPFFVMEYVPGQDLAHFANGRPQPERVAAEIIEALSAAMQLVHDDGIIHRDLKPANILLASKTSTDTEVLSTRAATSELHLTPKITDFGIAKRLDADSSQTGTGTVLGTPSYMSPEQARGGSENLGPAADIYALGAILYELLTGRPPFDGASPGETISQVLTDEPLSPARLRPALPRDLVTICMKCLEKDPRRRYARAADLAEDLHRYLAGEPIRARPIGVSERVWRWCRRKPMVAALTVTSGLLTIALTLTIVVYQSLLKSALAVQLEQTEQEAARQGRLAEEERRQLSNLDIFFGFRELEDGDDFTALVWMTEALRLDTGDRRRETRDRIRIALTLQHCPRLVPYPTSARRGATIHMGFGVCWQAAVSADRVLQVTNLLTGQSHALRDDVMSGKDATPVAISADGRFVAVAGSVNSITVRETGSSQTQNSPMPTGGRVQHATFSDNNQILIVHLQDRTVQVWDWRGGRQILLEGRAGEVTRDAVASDNGRWLFTISATGMTRAWSAMDGKPVAAPKQIGWRPASAAIRPDGRKLALADETHALWLWDISSGENTRLLGPIGHQELVQQIHWSADGKRILTSHSSGVFRVWDVATGTPATPPLTHHGRVVLAGFAGNDTALTIDDAGSIRAWDLGSYPKAIAGAEGQIVTSTVAQASTVRLPIKLADGKTVRVPKPSTHAHLRSAQADEQVVEHAAFSPDGSRAATATTETTVSLWDCASGKRMPAALEHRAAVVFAAFSPDGRHVATACADGIATLWEVETGERIAVIPNTHLGLERVAFAADGKKLIATHRGGAVSVWNLTPERRLVSELVSLAHVLSGRKISEDGTLVPLGEDEIRPK